ncbi:MAG: trypsin-like peptidase domain-containing protein [Filifactor alocis]|nr:trypsin-like peptidase domain-containing protein [Filifactor alocis]
MSGRKSVFLSTVVGVLVGCLLSVAAMPYFLERADLSIQKNNVESTSSNGEKLEKVTYVETTDNIYKEVAKKAMPSVVGIQTTTMLRNDFWGFTYPATGVGTGIIVREDGYILTNYHVVDGAESGEVNVLLSDGTKEEGEVVWGNSNMDLAVVKIDKKGLQAAELGDSSALEVGDLAIAIGNPLGLEFERTMTEGIISGLNRSLQVDAEHVMDNLIQTSAAINRGNSGGPLLNSKGQVIGINTLKEGAGEALGFAIPINSAKPIVDQVIKTGKVEKVVLGIKGHDVEAFRQMTGEDYGAKDGGIVVFKVYPDTSAKQAGLRELDVIVEMDGKKVRSMEELSTLLYSYKKGDKVELKVMRDGKEIKMEVYFR